MRGPPSARGSRSVMTRRHLATCTLCEAAFGNVVETEGERVTPNPGDPTDPPPRRNPLSASR